MRAGGRAVSGRALRMRALRAAPCGVLRWVALFCGALRRCYGTLCCAALCDAALHSDASRFELHCATWSGDGAARRGFLACVAGLRICLGDASCGRSVRAEWLHVTARPRSRMRSVCAEVLQWCVLREHYDAREKRHRNSNGCDVCPLSS